MKLKSLPLVVVLALTPSVAFSQSQTLTNCHTPESAGNFIGPDETIANGMVCKVVKTQPAQQQQVVARQSVGSAQSAPNPQTTVHGSTITNSRVIEMSKLGLDDEIIIAKIKNGSCEFQLGDTDLVDLKKAGVSPKVIAALLEAGPSASTRTTTNSNEVPTANGPSLVEEVGVYFRSGDKWVDLPPEVVNWKTGGVVKHVGTLGVVKGDVNGKLRGGSSKSHLKQPVELLVYATEGVAITEYQLIRFRTHSDSREFRTITGGVLHVSGGADRDTLEFTNKHVAQRTWTIPLGDLKPGEYGLLPPGLSASSSASSQLGKMYTFTIQ